MLTLGDFIFLVQKTHFPFPSAKDEFLCEATTKNHFDDFTTTILKLTRTLYINNYTNGLP
jgi:hypothetical protein